VRGEIALALAALVLIAGTALFRAAFGDPPSIVAIACLVAPGFAVLALLPDELRLPPISWLLAAPLGFAISSIVLITASGVGIPLTEAVVYLLLAAACAAGLAAAVRFSGSAPPARLRARFAVAPEIPILFGAALLVGIGLEQEAIGGFPLPGGDWAHYLLYSTEIAHHHGLLLHNPYWMLGKEPFAEDPGAPSLYAAYLMLSGAGPGLLYHGIWAFATLGIVTTYVFVRTLFGDVAGVAAAAVCAVCPLTLNVLTWHGLANVYAIMYIPLALLGAGMMLRRRFDLRWSGFLALTLVALVAAHRLSFLIVAVAFFFLIVLALARAPRRETVRFLLRTALTIVAVGFGVAIYLARQSSQLGGLQSYKAYLPTKISAEVLELLVNDMTRPLIWAVGIAVVVLLLSKRLRTDQATYVPIGFLAGLLVIGYAWIGHFPTEYSRVIYYLPIPVGALIGIGLSAIPRRLALVLGVLLIALVAPRSYTNTQGARHFYNFVNPGSEHGLDFLRERLEPGDVVTADSCWSFLATWELRHRVLGGLDPSLSLAGSEVQPASIARKILVGSQESLALAKRYHVHYALIDPSCTDEHGGPPAIPKHGQPVFESTHLVIIRF
jgi:hypothetical protein